MQIKLHCPGCSKSLSAKEELAGRRVKCPACGTPIEIPTSAKKPAPKSDPAPDVGGWLNLPKKAEATGAPDVSRTLRQSRWPWALSGAALLLLAGVTILWVLDDRSAVARVDVEEARQEITRLKTEIVQTKAETDRATADLERLKLEVANAKAETDAANTDRERLKLEVATAKTEKDRAVANLERLRLEVAKAKVDPEPAKELLPTKNTTGSAGVPANPGLESGKDVANAKPDPKPKDPDPAGMSDVPEAKTDPKAAPAGHPALPPLDQHIKTVRVWLADTLPTAKLLKTIRDTYEPHGIRIVEGKPAETEPVKEDAVLIATHFVQRQQFGENHSGNYLWVDMKQKYATLGSSFTNSYSSGERIGAFIPPLYVKDTRALVASRTVKGNGIPTDDGRYLLSREGRGPEEMCIRDVQSGEVVYRHKVPGKWTSSLVVSPTRLCSINDKGLELFDLSKLPALGKPALLFSDKEVDRNAAFSGQYLVVRMDERVHVVSTEVAATPRVVFTEPGPTGHFTVGPGGRIWLFAPAKEKDGKPTSVEVRLARIQANGTIRVEQTVTTEALGGSQFALGDNMAFGLQSWWDPRPEHSLHLFDLQGGSPKLVGKVKDCPADDVIQFGSLIAVRHHVMLSLYSVQDPTRPARIVDIPLGARRPIKVDGVKGLPVLDERIALVGVGSFLWLESQDPEMRPVGGTLLAYCGGQIHHIKFKQAPPAGSVKPAK